MASYEGGSSEGTAQSSYVGGSGVVGRGRRGRALTELLNERRSGLGIECLGIDTACRETSVELEAEEAVVGA